MSRFSEPSQVLIQEWAIRKAAAEHLEFGSSATVFSSERGGSQSVSWRNSEEGYNFRATNRGAVEIEGVTVRYLIVARFETIGRANSRDHVLRHYTGTTKFESIPPGETVRVGSRSVSLTDQSINAGWSPSGGGQRNARDRLVGVIAHFYYGDDLIMELAQPNSLLRDYTVRGPIEP